MPTPEQQAAAARRRDAAERRASFRGAGRSEQWDDELSREARRRSREVREQTDLAAIERHGAMVDEGWEE